MYFHIKHLKGIVLLLFWMKSHININAIVPTEWIPQIHLHNTVVFGILFVYASYLVTLSSH